MILGPQGQRPFRSIVTQTSAGHAIDNAQGDEISATELAQGTAQLAGYGPRIEIRSSPNPRYNCHGMTFASRRTQVFETDEIEKILHDDKYEEVSLDEVLPGDVVLYFDESGYDIEHSGVVVTRPTPETLRIPHVYSKWGKGPEVIHPLNGCPYNPSRVRYYRVR